MSQLIDENIGSQFERLPPSSIESERCLLASMILAGVSRIDQKLLFAKVRELVSRDALFQADHQIIFDCLCAMMDRNRAIDAMTLREELIKRQLLEEVGGTAYLGTILQSVPSPLHAITYANTVAQKFRLRELIRTSNEVTRRAYAASDANDQSEEILSFLSSEVVKIGREINPGTIITIGEAARSFLNKRFDTEFTGRIYTGLTDLDEAIGGFAKKRFIIIAGRPGSGKSQTGKQIAKNISTGVHVSLIGREEFDQPPIPVGLISIEEDDDKIAANMLSNASGVENKKITYRTASEQEWEEVEQSLERLDDLPFYIEDSALSVSAVTTAATKLVLEHKCQVILVDYLQLVDPELERGTENEKVGKISKTLKFLGKQLNVVLIAMAQLNRSNEKDQGKKKIRRPQMSDLRSSGEIEQNADVVLLLHREDYYRYKEKAYQPTHKLECDIPKNKDGAPGFVPLFFEGRTQSIRDYPKDSPADAEPPEQEPADEPDPPASEPEPDDAETVEALFQEAK